MKHEVDITTQLSMLPPTPGGLAVSTAVELDSGYYQTDPTLDIAAEHAPVTEQPEISRLRAEDTALDFLSKAAESNRNIWNMSRGLYPLQKAGIEQAEQTRLTRGIEKSRGTKLRFRWLAKTYIALAHGIDTEEVTEERFVEEKGVKEDVKMVVAKDPARQPQLSSILRSFMGKYEHNHNLRHSRRIDIAKQIEAISPLDDQDQSEQ